MYQAPAITDLGSVADFTLQVINKNPGSSDVIVIGGVSQPAPGEGVVSLS